MPYHCVKSTLSSTTARVPVFPLSFGDPERLARSLNGVAVLYNTYWVRFNHRDLGFAQAVANTKILFEAARSAGVQRIVHMSIGRRSCPNG